MSGSPTQRQSTGRVAGPHTRDRPILDSMALFDLPLATPAFARSRSRDGLRRTSVANAFWLNATQSSEEYPVLGTAVDRSSGTTRGQRARPISNRDQLEPLLADSNHASTVHGPLRRQDGVLLCLTASAMTPYQVQFPVGSVVRGGLGPLRARRCSMATEKVGVYRKYHGAVPTEPKREPPQ